jgi:outer membrane protein OmpA-like peptidoglycan-associated protein
VRPAATSQYFRPSKIALATACALALGLVSAAPLAQSLFDETRSKRQFPPTLTPDTTPAAAIARRAPESGIEKVILDAGALFDFDGYELRPEGRAALDEFLGSLDGATLGTIRAVGHADRLGSEGYNQILSEDRAEAVKAYLVSKGIEPGRVQAEGRGATQPVTKPGDCAGGKSAKILACLQPDRRVGIEVAGTRPFTGSAIWQALDRKRSSANSRESEHQ